MKSILLVDDEPLVVSFISSVAKTLGYRVEAAKDAAEALWLYELDPGIDALVTDIMMPGMDGFALAKTLRSKQPDLPILIISGFFQEGSDVAGGLIEGPQNHYLAKPFSKEYLVLALEQLFSPATGPVEREEIVWD